MPDNDVRYLNGNGAKSLAAWLLVKL